MKLLQVTALFLAFTAYTHISYASEFYKWTDENGITHFSQRKPTGLDSETISTKTKGKKAPEYIPFSAEAEAAENSKAKATKAPTPVAKQKAKKEEKQEAAPVKNEIKRDKAACEQAKKNQIALRNNPMVRQGGRLLTIEEKNEQLAKFEEVKKIHCE